MAKYKDLYEFVDRAVKSRKYPENTGYGLRAALKLFEGAVNEEESASLDKFKENLEQIYKGGCWAEEEWSNSFGLLRLNFR